MGEHKVSVVLFWRSSEAIQEAGTAREVSFWECHPHRKEDERARILARANGGRAAARKRGVKFGPKPKLAAHQEREAARMVHMEGLSLRAVVHHYHVGQSCEHWNV